MKGVTGLSLPRSVIIGTDGHIDHGKTSLVYALTGTDTDRLPEEKRRGITIDLGFAAMRLPVDSGSGLRVSFIDVPGHHAFIRNMLAGTGGIDAVLLVIAADEGVKAQTREHLDICSLLGIERGLVVLTKRDCVDAERLEQTQGRVCSWLSSTFLRAAPVLAVSAKTGVGIEELRHSLLQMATSIPPRNHGMVPRLAPDRAFAIRGFGTVVTGTLQSGSLHTGGSLDLIPEGGRVRVRGLQVHGQAAETVSAPSRVALNLAGIEHTQVRRGQMLVPPDLLQAGAAFDAEISLLPGAPPLKHRARVRLHAFTGDVAATVLLYAAESTSAGATALVRLQLNWPQVLVPGDRFVLRQPSPPATLGGGRVLDATPRRRQKKADTLNWLARLKAAGCEEQLGMRIARRGAAGATTKDLIAETGLTEAAIRATVSRLVIQGEVAASAKNDDFWIGTSALAEAEAIMLRMARESAAASIPRAELRSRSGLDETVFELALHRLTATQRLAGQETLSLPGRNLPDSAEQTRLAAVEHEYARAGIAPPLVREVAERLHLSEKQMRTTVTLLLRARRLLRLGSDDLFIHCDAVAKISADLRACRGQRFDVARFKSFTGLTRKHAIPLLELLDRSGVTRNQDGTRTVL